MSFDPTLVRGMSYYTGPIFEIAMDEFGGSVGGGGRYDEMIGKFTRTAIPVPVDFPLDLRESLCCFWKEDIRFLRAGAKKAYLIEKNMPADQLLQILKQADRRA